ncbi:hypothetical protein GLW03_02935 [Halobacillus halophilus]|uniref:hypothetical protein n=1 Tax=Halobacillus halophilus TaxID=1570 RepID=UPI00136BD3F7|nr:hypothetical protein [Halobacillus halophilus]MYL28768.1 hypothetical protein [Halobacillus halophilus]
MMLFGPLFLSLLPGSILLLTAWWFRKRGFSLFARLVPGFLLMLSAVILFYIGFVHIRGFEGGAYALLSFFLVMFAVPAWIIGGKGK